jgi:hypothetical protein
MKAKPEYKDPEPANRLSQNGPTKPAASLPARAAVLPRQRNYLKDHLLQLSRRGMLDFSQCCRSSLKRAIELARLAGKKILEHYAAGFITEEKIGADNYSEPVTIADREASRIIVDGLIASFPEDAVLSERKGTI